MKDCVEIIGSHDKGWGFSVRIGDTPIFRSDIDHPLFFGEYGVYESRKAAVEASNEMVLKNSVLISSGKDLGSGNLIKSMLVDKYVSMLEFCRNIYSDIVMDSNNDSYNNLNRTVPTLNKLLDDTAGSGKQIELLINEIETSTNDTFPTEPVSDITSDDVENVSSKRLIMVRDAMRELQSILKENFSRFITASYGKMKKSATAGEVLPILAGNMISNYINSVCGALELVSPVLEDMVESGGDCVCTIRSEDRRIAVVIGGDLTFRGVIDLLSPPFTYQQYLDVLRPAICAIGHIRPLECGDIILLAESDGTAIDSYGGFRIPKYGGETERITAVVQPVGGRKTKISSYIIKVSSPLSRQASTSFSDRMVATLRDNAENIANAALVKVSKPGSQYDGMAGTVDPDKIVISNDHVEFPVSVEYDTGLRTDVWLTDDDVEIYMSK
jgi:hypothetical protein